MLAIFKLGPSLFWSTKKKKKKTSFRCYRTNYPKIYGEEVERFMALYQIKRIDCNFLGYLLVCGSNLYIL